MTYLNKIVFLLLLLFVVFCLGGKCPRKCTCLTREYNVKKKDKVTRKLLRVDCRSKGMTEVYPQDEFPNDMQILDLSKNNISTIRRGFLDTHYKLERLYLHKNSIKVLEERAFVGLDLLNRLNIAQNKLVTLKKAAFLGLAKLKYLDLRNNRIRNIDKFAFQGLKSLTKLMLNNNTFSTISNGTFDELPSLRKIEMRSVPLICDCSLNPFVRYFAKKNAPKVLGTCQITKERLRDLKGTNLCEIPPDVSIEPSEDQIVSEGDGLVITCSTASKRRPKLYWTKNQIDLPRNVTVESSPSENKVVSKVKFNFIRMENGGRYRCNVRSRSMSSKEIAIKVITSRKHMCSRDVTMIHEERFLWPMTLERTTAVAACPWPNDEVKGVDTKIQRACKEEGVWDQVILGNCPMASLSTKLILLAKEIKKNDDVTSSAEKLKKITSQSVLILTAENMTRVFNVFVGIIQKNVPFKGQLLDDMLASFSNIMDVNSGTLYASQRKDQSPSRLGARLELISRGIVNDTSTRVQSNIVIGSVELKKIRSENKTCKVFFESDLEDGGVYCDKLARKDYFVSVHIPSTIFQNLEAAGYSKDSLRLQFLVYRDSKLFPNVISNETEDIMKDRNVSSSVLAIQMANIKELNLTDPLVIRFTTQPGTSPIVSHFDFSKNVIGRPWSQSTDCMVKESTPTMTTVECIRLVNKNLAVMSYLGITNVIVYPMEIVVYFGAVVASLLLIATLITFALARNVRFNRDDIIMLMNACLALFVVVLSFAFGIIRTENSIVCRAMGMSLHFFFFASLLWLGSYVVCVTRRLMPQKDTEEVFNPVLMYYMVSWGVPAIVCGMTVAGDMRNYKTTDYCWLTESAGLGAFVGPACLLFIINAVLLVRLHLLLARGITDLRPSEESTEVEQLQTDEQAVLEEVPDPSARQNAEKSAITFYLVATWVVMSLIYLNFILAYFLVNSRTSETRWICLSYVYALANITLGAAIFGFYCVARPEVRKAWRQTWKRWRAWKISCGPWYTLWITRGKHTVQINGRILVNGEDVTHRIESDRQSNITLPSSAALTNDVFVNGRPMSTARVSLLDDADFPPEENPPSGAVDNEVDITETTANSEENQRSHSSVHSERKSRPPEENKDIPEENQVNENTNLLPVPGDDDYHADITDGVTSKSESSAPTAIEVPQAHARPDSPVVEHPRIFPHAGVVRPFMNNGVRQFPVSSQGLPAHQFRPAFQKPFTHQFVSAQNVPPGQPSHQIPPARQVPPSLQVQPAHQALVEPGPPTYQAALDMASQSGSSICDSSALSRSNSNSKRKRNSNESLGSRNESGSVGPRARKLPQLQPQASSSSAISEVPAPVSARPSESTNARSAAQNLGPSTNNARPTNRYKDGRTKPEPKQWNGAPQNRIAYVAIPHVSKIHREPVHNETSV